MERRRQELTVIRKEYKQKAKKLERIERKRKVKAETEPEMLEDSIHSLEVTGEKGSETGWIITPMPNVERSDETVSDDGAEKELFGQASESDFVRRKNEENRGRNKNKTPLRMSHGKASPDHDISMGKRNRIEKHNYNEQNTKVHEHVLPIKQFGVDFGTFHGQTGEKHTINYNMEGLGNVIGNLLYNQTTHYIKKNDKLLDDFQNDTEMYKPYICQWSLEREVQTIDEPQAKYESLLSPEKQETMLNLSTMTSVDEQESSAIRKKDSGILTSTSRTEVQFTDMGTEENELVSSIRGSGRRGICKTPSTSDKEREFYDTTGSDVVVSPLGSIDAGSTSHKKELSEAITTGSDATGSSSEDERDPDSESPEKSSKKKGLAFTDLSLISIDNASKTKVDLDLHKSGQEVMCKYSECAPKTLLTSWIKAFIFLQDRTADVCELLACALDTKNLQTALLSCFNTATIPCTSLILQAISEKQMFPLADSLISYVLEEVDVPSGIVHGSFREMEVQLGRLSEFAHAGSVAIWKNIRGGKIGSILPQRMLFILCRLERYFGVKARSIIDACMEIGMPIFFARIERCQLKHRDTIALLLQNGKTTRGQGRHHNALISSEVFDTALEATGLRLSSDEPIVMFDRVRVEGVEGGEPTEELVYIVYHPDDCRLFIFIPALSGSYLDLKERIRRRWL